MSFWIRRADKKILYYCLFILILFLPLSCVIAPVSPVTESLLLEREVEETSLVKLRAIHSGETQKKSKEFFLEEMQKKPDKVLPTMGINRGNDNNKNQTYLNFLNIVNP